MWSILIIDDEKNVREGLSHFVQSIDGFSVCGTSSDGAEALNMCVRRQPNIIITDINMPHVDGLTFIARLKERSGDTPIIVISGYDYFFYVQQALRLGVQDYLLKPVNRKELEQRLKRIAADLEAGDQAPADRGETLQKKPAEACIEIVQRRFADPSLDIEQCAAELFLSSSHLRFLFKQATGQSFVKFVNTYRMEKAAELLQTTNLQVQDVAASVSFEDTHYFNNCFKKHTGMSPTDYRIQHSGKS